MEAYLLGLHAILCRPLRYRETRLGHSRVFQWAHMWRKLEDPQLNILGESQTVGR